MANDTFRLIGYIQDDLRNIQSKLVELRAQLAALDLPADDGRVPCSKCGLRMKGARTLAEHVYTSHGGPVPAHWVSGESLTEEEAA